MSNALIAATGVLIVTEPSIDASAGVANVMDSIETVREHYNPTSKFSAWSSTRSRPAVGKLTSGRPSSSTPGDRLWDPVVPMRTVLTEARGARDPIHSYSSRPPI
ncbi:hypothetical protein GS933_18335 [Rhodococcus hoagii]|nr:hypothetical protein [Prescottella equi]